jgi:DNA-binding response OmpR family regulator
MIQASHAHNAVRVLIVDDEPHIRKSLMRALELSGYVVESAESGQGALDKLRAARYDVMVLDMRLPDLDGTQVMHAARQLDPDLIILILTGHATLHSAITAVKAGATDYLLKPLSVQEIIAAIENAWRKHSQHLRRQQLIQTAIEALRAAENIPPMDTSPSPPSVTSPERFCQSGTLVLDRIKRVLTFTDDLTRVVALTEGEVQVLECLMDAADVPLSCRQIAKRLWGYELDEIEAESLVRPYIFRLRQKIERNPQNPTLIRTVRGRGYLFTSQPT